MPASEQTWYKLTLLHKIFGGVGLVLLVATIWMFVDDHSREWKPYQRTTNRIEIQLAQWRKNQYQTDEINQQLQALEEQIVAARAELLAPELIEQFKTAVQEDAARRREDELAPHKDGTSESQVEGTMRRIDRYLRPDESGKPVGYDRAVVEGALDSILERARFRENDILGRQKFTSANLDAAKANLGLAVRDEKSPVEQAALQGKVDALAVKVEDLRQRHQAAKRYRVTLQTLIDQMLTKVEDLLKQREEALRNIERLQDSIASRRSNYFEMWGIVPIPGKKWLEMPILDAFNSPLQIDNLWSDGLTQDYNFSEVRRFDRCTTCHQSIDKTMPGTADVPAYVNERLVTLTLDIPESEAEEVAAEGLTREQLLNKQLEKNYGILLADEGLVSRDDVTVEYVRQYSPAAKAETEDAGASAEGSEIRRDLLASARAALNESDGADRSDAQPGLRVGDVLVAIEGDPVKNRDRATLRLLDAIGNGERTMKVTVRRGLPHPYTSHPRLDLFVGSLSPHKVSDFACTVCHEGQGSATSFKWASHTPNTLGERAEWMKEYGWFDNVHWIYPMQPARFVEATCLKCHHDVTELQPSERFPEAPAPKVVHGYDLARKHGCYGCHEINGYEGPDKRIGPDMRLEPNYFAAAQALKLEEGSGFENLPPSQQELVNTLIENPERDHVRRELLDVIRRDSESDNPTLSEDVHERIAPLLTDVDAPGEMRKSGPALRFVDRKLDSQFLADWLLNPRHFRPSTRMPKFFGMWDHLDEESREVSEAFEPVEVLGMIEYLRQNSQEFEYLEQPQTDSPQLTNETVAQLYAGPGEDHQELRDMVARGRDAFMKRGCLACHSHEDFKDAEHLREEGEIVQGPDLSAIGSKFAPERNPNGYRWLYSWIKEPTRYHVRTVMPDLYLDPIQVKDSEGNFKTVDPVADIVAYLMAESQSSWEPLGVSSVAGMDAEMNRALDDLALEYLRGAVAYLPQAREYLNEGIPVDATDYANTAERELMDDQPGLAAEKKLAYVGRKTIARYGCYGCHDIPGFEEAKTIGTGLADWGRKETSKLAFEHIIEYLHGGHGEGHGGAAHGAHAGSGELEAADPHAAEATWPEWTGGGTEYGEMPDFFMHALESHHRSGFIYQKLREPRSYDYHKTRNKGYTERLRMPHFNFGHDQREAVITFVLGLVADPPNPKYVYSPNERQQALIAGRQVLEKYNCGGCHIIEAEQWQVAFNPDWELFQGPTAKESETFPFLRLKMTPDKLEASTVRDDRGMVHARLPILPKLSPQDGMPFVQETEDDIFPAGVPVIDDEPYRRRNVAFDAQLLDSVPIDGMGYPSGETISVPSDIIEKAYPSRGGFLAKYLLNPVTEEIGQSRGAEAWTWVPPMLVGEGSKVQSNWLHEFLLNPYPIRPAVVLRMPRFNMSSEEAAELVHYFAARDRAQHPYEFSRRRQPEYLDAKDLAYGRKLNSENPPHGQRFEDAMKIVVDKKVYCAQCHQIGDYYPEGQPSAHGPDLTKVAERLRADYLRDWIADPKRILPYTAMPKNIPFDENKPLLGTNVPQEYYQGDSIEQLNALVDLLLNTGRYLQQRSSFTQMVQQSAPSGTPEATTTSATTPAASGGDAAAQPAAAEVATGGAGEKAEVTSPTAPTGGTAEGQPAGTPDVTASDDQE